MKRLFFFTIFLGFVLVPPTLRIIPCDPDPNNPDQCEPQDGGDGE